MKDADFCFNSLPTNINPAIGDRYVGEEVPDPISAPYLTSTIPQRQLNSDTGISSGENLQNFNMQSISSVPAEPTGMSTSLKTSSNYQTTQPMAHGYERYLAPSTVSSSIHGASVHGAPFIPAQGPSSLPEEQPLQHHYQNYIKSLESKISYQTLPEAVFAGASSYNSNSNPLSHPHIMTAGDTELTTGNFYNYQNNTAYGAFSSYGTENRETPNNELYSSNSFHNEPAPALAPGEYGYERVYSIDESRNDGLRSASDQFMSTSWDSHQNPSRKSDLNTSLSQSQNPLYNPELHLNQGQVGCVVGNDENARSAVSRNRIAMMTANGKSYSLAGTRDRSAFLDTFLTQVSESPQLGMVSPYEQPLRSENLTNLSKQMLFASNKDYHLTSANNLQYRNLTETPYSSVSSFSSAGHKNSLLYNLKNDEAHEPGRKKGNYNIVRGGLGGPNNRPILDNPNVKYLPLKLRVLNASASAINTTPWTPEEVDDGRRIIRVERIQNGASLEVLFKVVKPESIKPVGVSGREGIDWVEVSMIKFDSKSMDDTEGYFMTSVEFIEVIECLIGHKTLVHSERRKARGRIRLNLMRFWLKTPLPSRDSLKSGEHDSQVVELALKIRKYSVSKPPGFNKEVRIMPWEKLVAAMQHALEYYFAEVPIGEGCEE